MIESWGSGEKFRNTVLDLRREVWAGDMYFEMIHLYIMGWQTFLGKGQIMNSLGFGGHTAFASTTGLPS